MKIVNLQGFFWALFVVFNYLHVDKKRILIDCLTGPVDAMIDRSGISLDKFFKTLYKRERIVDRIPLLLGVGGGGSHGDSGSQAKGGGL